MKQLAVVSMNLYFTELGRNFINYAVLSPMFTDSIHKAERWKDEMNWPWRTEYVVPCWARITALTKNTADVWSSSLLLLQLNVFCLQHALIHVHVLHALLQNDWHGGVTSWNTLLLNIVEWTLHYWDHFP